MQIKENRLIAKVIDKEKNPLELNAAYALRYKVFVDKLHWLPPENYPNLQEIDAYDNHCIEFGVFALDHKLVGYMRLILYTGEFMLEKEFTELSAGEKIRKEPGVAEISRLAILPGYEFNGRKRTALLLYKILYHWAISHDIHFFYMVTDDKFYQNLKRQGLVCNKLQASFQYQKGVTALAAYADLATRLAFLQTHNPGLFAYFTNK